MIPKKIHYCWFGRGEYPEKIKKCIESWKRFLPDYEFCLWNEDNFDLNQSDFVSQAYRAGQFAFVSDYVRIFALKNYGGIYLDTDIEVVKPFDDILKYDVILSMDDVGMPSSAFIGAVPNHSYFNELLSFYDQLSFYDKRGRMNLTPNTRYMDCALKKYGFEKKNKHQKLNNGIVVFPCNYFEAKSLINGKSLRDENTYCIHHHTLLWVPTTTKLIKFLRIKILIPIMGDERYINLVEKIKSIRNHEFPGGGGYELTYVSFIGLYIEYCCPFLLSRQR